MPTFFTPVKKCDEKGPRFISRVLTPIPKNDDSREILGTVIRDMEAKQGGMSTL